MKNFLATNGFRTIIFLLFLFLVLNTSAQWQPTNGPNSAFPNCFATLGKEIFLGTNGAGIYKSSDTGTNWIEINSGLSNRTVQCLVTKDTLLFAGTRYGGIFRSSDKGITWTAMTVSYTHLDVYKRQALVLRL